MNADRVIAVMADSVLVVAPVDQPLVSALERMLVDPSPMPAFRAVQAHLESTFPESWFTEPNTGRNEAEERLRAALITAYDPVADAAALRRALHEIRDSLAAEIVTSGTSTASVAADVDGHANQVEVSSISFLYMNGVWTSEDAARITRTRYLEPTVALAGFSDRRVFPVDEVYNKTGAETDALEEVWICLGIKADLILSGRLSSGANLEDCFTQIASAPPWVGDIWESVQQLVNRMYSDLPARVRNDAARLAARIVEELAGHGRVIVIAHSQGNLMLTEALQFVAQYYPDADLRCVGAVGIAPPAPILHPAGIPEQMIIRGTRTADILAQYLITTSSIRSVGNDLSDIYSLALASAPPVWIDVLRFSQGLRLHKIDWSYLGEYRTRYEVITALKNQARAVLDRCPGTPVVTTRAASNVTSDYAILNGSVMPGGNPSTAWFEYGADPSLAVHGSTYPLSVGSGIAPVPISVGVGGVFAPGTTYYFRAAASNSSGTTMGEILSFTTSPGANLEVTTVTSGQALDPDGYLVTVDAVQSQLIGINGVAIFRNLASGGHVVGLSGIATNCTVVGDNARTVTVSAGGTVQTTFTVTCQGSGVGSLLVTTQTTGQNLDPDGYVVSVDGGQPQPIGINGALSFANLPAGDHLVELGGIATNCRLVVGQNPRTLTVPAGGSAQTTFGLECQGATSSGDLQVTTSTTGQNLDPDGYVVTVDGGQSPAIGINATVTFSNLTAGDHVVELGDIATNCTLVAGQNPRPVTVPAGSSAQTTFEVTCTSGAVWATVSGGDSHTCAVASGGAAYCWGDNILGELGNGGAGYRSTIPVPVSGGLVLSSISAAANYTCGVTTDGRGYCWGSGPLGNGASEYSAVPVEIAGGLSWASVSAGLEHACGVTTDFRAYCWGSNVAGQLGNGTYLSLFESTTPVLVSGDHLFAAVSVGHFHSCGLTAGGSAYCWGANAKGQLGNGTPTNTPIDVPVAVASSVSYTSLTSGDSHTCAVATDHLAYCWGGNFHGALGDGTADDQSVPMAVVGGLSLSSMSAGRVHTCAATSSHAGYCWGDNNPYGQLGDGFAVSWSTVPLAVSGGLSFSAVGEGDFHTCAITPDGAAYCWGRGDLGQLGNDLAETSWVPVRVSEPRTASVRAGL